jgi:preprotein translocase subunit SecE
MDVWMDYLDRSLRLKINQNGTGDQEKMDSKKGIDPDKKSYFSPAGIRSFLREVHAEFRKIVWPPKKTTTGLTGFVILLVIVLSLYLGSVDLLLGKLVSTVLN